MWTHQRRQLENRIGAMVCMQRGESKLSYGQVLELWENEASFRDYFIQLLQETPYRAFRWETPPLTRQSLTQPFEFVVLSAPELELSADRATFAEHFNAHEPGCVRAFPNLGGDAMMVVPGPVDNNTAYAHLADFLKTAPAKQVHDLWKLVGNTVRQRVNDDPVWVSTAGGGVAWLHIRLDSRPKYYAYEPYRNAG